MRSLEEHSLFGALIHGAAWVAGTFIGVYVFQDAASRWAYGMISGWWCALYVGYIFRVRIKAALVVGVGYFVFGVAAVSLDWSWFYHDMPTNLSLAFAGTLAGGALVFVGPILMNAIVRRLVG